MAPAAADPAALWMQALNAVQSSLDGLTSGCQAANKAVASSDASTANMLAVKEKLQHALATREQRGLLVHKFLSRYQLSAAEVAALQASLREKIGGLADALSAISGGRPDVCRGDGLAGKLVAKYLPSQVLRLGSVRYQLAGR